MNMFQEFFEWCTLPFKKELEDKTKLIENQQRMIESLRNELKQIKEGKQ